MILPNIDREKLASLEPTVSREELAKIYGISQGYLGYLLREHKVPLPVQINNQILWYSDEVQASLPRIKKALEKRKTSH